MHRGGERVDGTAGVRGGTAARSGVGRLVDPAQRRAARWCCPPGPARSSAPLTCSSPLALVAGSVVNVELGRLLEGGRVAAQRPHKALSAWPMAATILLPSFYLVPIVALIYLHARWRGVRVTLWKWIVSACFLICAGAISGVVVAVGGGGAPPTLSSGLPGLLFIVGAVLTFLAGRVGDARASRR